MISSRQTGKSLPLVLLAAAVSIPAHANLVITPTFDSSITGQGANAAPIEATINQAISIFESTYSTPINVTIEFYATTTGLGESQEGFTYNDSYSSYYNALVATDANPLAIAGLNSSGGNATNNPVNGTSTIEVKSADNRAVGLSGAPLCNVVASGIANDPLKCSGTAGGPGAIDGLVGLNTNITSPPNGEGGATFSLLATTMHEIDEVLGLGSSLPNCNSAPPTGTPCTSTSASNPAPEDLFRYISANTFASLSENCASLTPDYFSYDGVTSIVNMNTACNGGDWGDWTGSGTVQNWQASGGAAAPYSTNELDAMSAIGYGLASTVPEPATFALAGASLLALALVRNRRTRKN